MDEEDLIKELEEKKRKLEEAKFEGLKWKRSDTFGYKILKEGKTYVIINEKLKHYEKIKKKALDKSFVLIPSSYSRKQILDFLSPSPKDKSKGKKEESSPEKKSKKKEEESSREDKAKKSKGKKEESSPEKKSKGKKEESFEEDSPIYKELPVEDVPKKKKKKIVKIDYASDNDSPIYREKPDSSKNKKEESSPEKKSKDRKKESSPEKKSKSKNSLEEDKKEESSREHYCDKIEDIGKLKKGVSIVKKSGRAGRIIGYNRVSSREQLQEGFSLDEQESKIYNEAEKRGEIVRAIYVDGGKSGRTIKTREGLSALLEEIEEGDIIICPDVSRMARNARDLLEICNKVQEKNASIEFLNLPLDHKTPHGKFQLTLMAGVAELDSNILSKRIKDNHHYLASTNRLATKNPPYGKMVNPNATKHGNDQLIDCPKEIKIINTIRDIVAKNPNCSYGFIKKKLEERRVPPPRNSSKWFTMTVKRITDLNHIEFDKTKEKISLDINRKEKLEKNIVYNFNKKKKPKEN